MKPDNWIMPLVWAELLAEVATQPNCVVGAYMRAMGNYWVSRCKGLPAQEAALIRLCGCDREDWEAVEAALFGEAGYFVLEGARWHHKRVRCLWEHARNVSESRRANMEVYWRRAKGFSNG
jgi:uncharacterized protein YdaU (DUF1376 family)